MQFKVPAQPENEKNEGRRNGERDVNLKKKKKPKDGVRVDRILYL